MQNKCTEGPEMTAELTAHVLPRGRQTKFTPERIQADQESGRERKEPRGDRRVDRGDPGSLQVTCSRLGVSLRRPISNTGTGLLRRGAPGPNGTANHHAGDANNSVILQLTKERPEQNSQSAPVGASPNSYAAPRAGEKNE